MKKIITLFLGFLPLVSIAQSKRIKYLNIEGNEVSYHQFYKIHVDKGCTVGQNEDGSVYRLIAERSLKGKITDYKELIDKINTELHINLSSNQPLFICYSPGPDKSNTSELYDLNGVKAFRSETSIFEKKLQKMINGQTLFVFKRPSMYVYEKHEFIPWKQDPRGEIEKRFFSDYHYLHSSFVLLFPNGEYNVYLGEFSYDYVFDYVKTWKKANKIK